MTEQQRIFHLVVNGDLPAASAVKLLTEKRYSDESAFAFFLGCVSGAMAMALIWAISAAVRT